MTAISEAGVLAIDIGGTKIALGIVVDGTVIERVQVPTPRSGRGVDIVAAIAEQARQMPVTKSAGIATTGIVDDGHLTALNAGTLPIEDRFPLVAAVRHELQRSVTAINDAQAAAWAEYRRGAGRGSERMVFVTVSTGIGGGLVLDGRLQIGRHGLAGHIGHMVGDPNGPACGCGRVGCIERIASGTAIGQRASLELGRAMTAPDVFAATAIGDDICNAIIDRAATSLARVICDLTASLDLDRVVVGGGVGMADGFLDRLRAASERQPEIYRRPLVAAALKADAGLIGIAELVYDEIFH